MNPVQSAMALLRRPVAIAAAAPATTASRRRTTAPSADEPATEQDYLAELRRLNELEAESRARIASAGEERERLLLAGEEYEELAELERSISRANFDLDRITRTRPAIVLAITKIRRQRERAEWIPVRDDTVTFLRERVLPAIDAYRAALAEWRAKYFEVTAKFPQATEVLPLAPSLYDGGMSFEVAIDTFATRILIPDTRTPPTLLRSLASAIDFAQRTGKIPDGIDPLWRVDIERAMSGKASVKLNVSIIDGDGRSVAAGTVLTLPYDEATKHVQSGRAVYD